MMNIFFEGISEPTKWDNEPKPIIINGKEYDYYHATQKQRQMERNIRSTKREIEAQKAIGGDTTVLNAKLKKQMSDYKKFSADVNIRPKNERLRVQAGSSVLNGKTKSKGFRYSYKGEAEFSSGEKWNTYLEQVGTQISKSKGNMIMKNNIKTLLSSEWTADNSVVSFEYDPIKNRLLFNPSINTSEYNMSAVIVHELTHKMDVTVYQSWENKDFLDAINKTSKYVIANKEIFQKAVEPGGAYFAKPEINDIIVTLSNGQVYSQFSHEVTYWNNITIASEIFSNIAVLDILELEGKAESKGFLNLIFDAYKKMVEG